MRGLYSERAYTTMLTNSLSAIFINGGEQVQLELSVLSLPLCIMNVAIHSVSDLTYW